LVVSGIGIALDSGITNKIPTTVKIIKIAGYFII